MGKRFDQLSFLENIICICYYGRSGSVFLHSLLDNHPDVITFPGVYLMGYQEWWNSISNLESNKVIENFLDTYKVIFDPCCVNGDELPGCGRNAGMDQNFHQSGENNDKKIAVNKKKFTEQLWRLNEEAVKENPLGFFKKIHLALAHTQNKNLNQKSKIVFHLHTPLESNAKFLLSNVKSVKILYSIREPHISAISLYKHYMKNGGVDKPLKFVLSYMNEFSPMRSFASQSIGVRLEDLHLKTDATLKLLSEFCEIDMHKNLKESTFLGIVWNNLPGTNKVQGFNQVIPNKRHTDLISTEDEQKYQFLFQRVYLYWEYISNPIYKFSLLSLSKKFRIEKKDNFLNYLEARLYIIKIIIENNKHLKKIFFWKKKSIISLLK